MIKLRPERFPPGTMKKLYTWGAGPFKIIKKIGPNAYVLELSPDFGISLTFNIPNLKEYIELILIPSEPFRSDPIFESETPPECPSAMPPVQRDRVERILDDQTIVTRNKGYQRYLVRWQGQPKSKDSWITRKDLQQIDLDLLERYHNQLDPYSIGSSFSHPKRIGVDTRSKRRLQLGSLWMTT